MNVLDVLVSSFFEHKLREKQQVSEHTHTPNRVCVCVFVVNAKSHADKSICMHVSRFLSLSLVGRARESVKQNLNTTQCVCV